MSRSKTKTRTGGSRRSPKAPRRPRSFTPVSDALSRPFTFADTEIAEGIQRHGLSGLLAAVMQAKRRPDAEPLNQVLCALLIWPLLKVASIHCFCAELGQVLSGKVSVLYDFLGREDINWRGLASELARRVFRQNELGARAQRAFVVDDTSKARAGRKVQGTSCYFDHTESRTRKGHQMLQLGLAAEKGFLPLESQLVMGEKAAVDKPQDKPFKDHRSAAARDMARAREQNKQKRFRDMLQRAVRAGFSALYVLADAWFGCKENILCVLELGLIGIFQMKRGNLAYEYQGQSYTATQLYAKVRRRMRPLNARARYKTASLTVRLNLQTDNEQPANRVEVRLVFSTPRPRVLSGHLGRLSVHGRNPQGRENPGGLCVALVHRSLLQGDQTESGLPQRTERSLRVGLRFDAFGGHALLAPL